MVAPGGALLTAPTPDAFGRGIARLLDDPALRAAMGAAARRFVATERTLEGFQDRLAAGLALVGLPCARSTSR
jgi:glycosyltransferase involved in cell wall biosynthesis